MDITNNKKHMVILKRKHNVTHESSKSLGNLGNGRRIWSARENSLNYMSFHVRPHLYRNVTILLLYNKQGLFMKVNILNIKNHLN
jgi:hypothetical protein